MLRSWDFILYSAEVCFYGKNKLIFLKERKVGKSLLGIRIAFWNP